MCIFIFIFGFLLVRIFILQNCGKLICYEQLGDLEVKFQMCGRSAFLEEAGGVFHVVVTLDVTY